MELLKLNPNPEELIKLTKPHGYEIDPSKSYYIDISDNHEFEHVMLTQQLRELVNETKGMKSYKKFCKKYNLESDSGNEDNAIKKIVKNHFPNGGPLWKDEFSQGIIVEVDDLGNVGIVVEMSRENTGFKYTRILATVDL
jgi:hypothetical protein